MIFDAPAFVPAAAGLRAGSAVRRANRPPASAIDLLEHCTGAAGASLRALVGTPVTLKGFNMRRSLAALMVALLPLGALATSPQTTVLDVQT